MRELARIFASKSALNGDFESASAAVTTPLSASARRESSMVNIPSRFPICMILYICGTFCLRRAFHFEITRRNVLSSARKAGISAAPAETRGSQARAIMASLKLDFPVKNVQVFGRYRRNPPNSYGRPLFVVAFLLYWCKKGAQFLHALKYRFAPAAVFYSPRRTFPFRRIILW